MAESSIPYKIAALRLIERAKLQLTNNQICGFFTSCGYNDYFSTQQLLSELEKAEQITCSSKLNNTFYSLTPEGYRTLEAMSDKLTSLIEDDIISYLKEIQVEINIANSLTADYYKATGGGYLVRCTFTQDKQVKLDISLHAATQEIAETIVSNWKAHYEDAYASLLDTLI